MLSVIVVAAGRGSRLGVLTDSKPKCLVEYQGQALLSRALTSLPEESKKDVVIVTGYKSEALASYPGRKVLNADWAETNMVHSFFCAEEYFGERVLLLYGDIVFNPAVITRTLAAGGLCVMPINTEWRSLWEARMDDPLADLETLKIDSEGYLREIGSRPRSYEEVAGQYMGIISFNAEGLAAIRGHYHRLREGDPGKTRSLSMTEFINSAVQAGLRVKTLPIPGGWIEIDEPSDLELRDSFLNLKAS